MFLQQLLGFFEHFAGALCAVWLIGTIRTVRSYEHTVESCLESMQHPTRLNATGAGHWNYQYRWRVVHMGATGQVNPWVGYAFGGENQNPRNVVATLFPLCH